MLRFCQLTNRPYAAFLSLRKEVTIGVLKGYVADLQLKKSHITVDVVLTSELNYQMLFGSTLPN